ncbi:FAD-binding domain-containing protein [Mycena epipterygia]|nr:FAD-binding domain-containing protein [Mycena epipterygia]
MDLSLPLLLVSLAAAVSGSSTPILNVSPDQWRALNASVGGRLHVATPFALPCFSLYQNRTVAVDVEACNAIKANYTSPEFRVESFSANMNVEWETCISAQSGCLLDGSNPQDPFATQGKSCGQGEVPPYYINITVPSDVQAAFAFSAKTKVPLSIKNTGHDYLGRSRRRDSLGLWTHNLQTMSFHPKFVPDLCHGDDVHRAITVGAGVRFDQIYKFADENESTFLGGYAETVGVSGGWMMGGGHSVLSPTLGLGVDRVLEIKIVTPDGKLRTANSCQNTDLFWALRGGGGGTFGVVVESTHLVEQQITIQAINMTFTPTNANLQEYYEILVNNSAHWSELGWGGHVNSPALGLPAGIIYVNPRLSLAEATDSMAQLSAFALANNGTSSLVTLPSWYEFFLQFITKAQAPVGGAVVIGSRLIPKANFESAAGRKALVAQMVNQTATRGMPYIPVDTPIGFNYTVNATSVSPAWRNSVWLYQGGSGWAYNSSVAQITAVLDGVHEFVDELRALAPNSGTYMNEGEIFESDHEVTYWGPNYPRLLSIKQKYDPLGLLDCWRCVGWKTPSESPCYPPQ